ncbi:MAG: hypothetical protein KBS81_08935 [Spirochaetales bacterium]|nr:hypothetical protein [Candidatus Physcosoma equi]
MVLLENIIHIIYFVFSFIIAVYLVKHLFKRDKHKTWVYDLVYAYTLIPFVLRFLYIK